MIILCEIHLLHLSKDLLLYYLRLMFFRDHILWSKYYILPEIIKKTNVRYTYLDIIYKTLIAFIFNEKATFQLHL